MSKKSDSKKPKSKKLSAPQIETVEGLKATVNQVVELQAELARKVAKHEETIAELNSLFDGDTAELVARIEAYSSAAHIYCESHRQIFPEPIKHLDCRNARVGFRLNPWKVEKLVSKDTFEAIAKRVQAAPWGAPFVVVSEPELAKDRLLSERANLTEEQLAAVGLKITQGETFYIDPVIESAEGASVPEGRAT